MSSDNGGGFLDSDFELNYDDNELVDVFVEDGVRHFDVNLVNEAKYMVQDKREDGCMVQIEKGKKGGVTGGIKGPLKKWLVNILADDFVGDVRMRKMLSVKKIMLQMTLTICLLIHVQLLMKRNCLVGLQDT